MEPFTNTDTQIQNTEQELEKSREHVKEVEARLQSLRTLRDNPLYLAHAEIAYYKQHTKELSSQVEELERRVEDLIREIKRHANSECGTRVEKVSWAC